MMLVQPRRVVVVDLDGLALLAVEATQDDCVAVVHRGRVVALTKAAQAHGVVVGMRCVEAMARYPHSETKGQSPPIPRQTHKKSTKKSYALESHEVGIENRLRISRI
jgi:nucleotidyltransferase/DNA polymerase involved in DNA repair